MHIANHTFVVSGGSSGLGAACARRMAERGANVVIADVDAAGEQLAGQFEKVLFQHSDVTDEAAVRAIFDLARERFGRVDGAVVCAGIIRGRRLLEDDGTSHLETFRRVIEVNLNGTFNVLQQAAAAMQGNAPDEVGEGERGVIVLTSSVAAFEGQIGQAAYAASKGGVAALTLPAARELGRVGIRVVSIAPGVFETPMMEHVPEKYRQSLHGQVPFPQRFGRPEEFAALVEHVIENRMLNGAVLRLDGGLRMGPR
jgi:NAD(P)-dependent dehydrogenase (short-subunit alcohol dehydrogenase family)